MEIKSKDQSESSICDGVIFQEKQLQTLAELHDRKAEFILKEACRVESKENQLLQKIEKLDKKVEKAEKLFVA